MTQYVFPFQGDKLIELGGGTRPLFRPNVDVRAGPSVDIVADFHQPLSMLESAAYDGVFSQFAIEHISWRRVRAFIRETHRILRPGGSAVFITANLLEQVRKLVEAKHWNDDLIGTIFGGNDYAENTHRCGFSPDYITLLMKQAGYFEVRVVPHPMCATDMLVEAHKSRAEIITHKS
ncbi:MAG TPA: methyltransferase domain-containing protein [Polyangiaceae bacterium]